jgi:thioredoxin 1
MILTEGNFASEVLESSEPVMIDFWATWCGPCRSLAPIVDNIGKTVSGVKVGKVNIEEEPGLASKYNIGAIPSLLFFKNGEEVDRVIGLKTEAVLKEKLESLK